MANAIIFHFTYASLVLILVLLFIKIYIFAKYKNNDWKTINFLYFSENDLKKQTELLHVKSANNNITLIITMLCFLLVLIVTVK